MPSGKSFIAFQPPYKLNRYNYVQLPCGRCIGCRLEKSRQHAIRATHESQMHKHNCFITLTFAPEHLNESSTLVKSDFQNFMKRLRNKIFPKKVKFLHCGEYGEKNLRPHHHALIFGYDFPDKKIKRIYSKGGKEITTYTSKVLETLWTETNPKSPYYAQPLGLSEIGECNFETAAYIARYTCKKQNIDKKTKTYQCLITKSKTTKDNRLKEYITMSLRPGLGKSWLDKYGDTDVFAHDSIVLRGKTMKPPKYYSRQLELHNPKEHARLVDIRKKKASSNPDNRWERLPSREKCTMERFKQLQRSL